MGAMMPILLCPLLAGLLATAPVSDEGRVLDPGFHHLGDDSQPAWTEAEAQARPGPLQLSFESSANWEEAVLSLRQRNVDDVWRVLLNGVEVATLERHEDQRQCFYALPAGSLVDGTNTLEFQCETRSDDVTLGDVRLHSLSLERLLDLASFEVRVTDTDGAPLPARLTLLTADGQPARVFSASGGGVAVRPGLVYGDGSTLSLSVPRGTYELHASRGLEWSQAQQTVQVGSDALVTLSLVREVDTRGFVAADTHIHTLTHSGHGDASLAERIVTLAGEGVELAIATDHNHNTDYRPQQQAAGLSAWYTAVTGNEVTTPLGHFNAFPLDPQGELPLHDSHDWTATVEDMRAKGALAVILNHPRWPAHGTGPFGVEGLDPLTGERRTRGAPFGFDAMELVNSTTDTPDPMVLFNDWFALLNGGERVFAVGSSDSHTVGDPVGRGRTYVRSASDDPAALDVDALALDIAEGHASVSLGLFLDVRIRGRPSLGHMTSVDDQVLDVEVVIRSPSWSRPERLVAWMNGRVVMDRTLSPAYGKPVDLRLPLSFDVEFLHDAWLVIAAFGPGAGGVAWPGLNDYVLAAGNPIFLDVDGDGVWQSPKDVARARWSGTPNTMDMVGTDEAVMLQYLVLAQEFYERQARQRLNTLGEGLARRHPLLKQHLDGRTREPDRR